MPSDFSSCLCFSSYKSPPVVPDLTDEKGGYLFTSPALLGCPSSEVSLCRFLEVLMEGGRVCICVRVSAECDS